MFFQEFNKSGKLQPSLKKNNTFFKNKTFFQVCAVKLRFDFDTKSLGHVLCCVLLTGLKVKVGSSTTVPKIGRKLLCVFKISEKLERFRLLLSKKVFGKSCRVVLFCQEVEETQTTTGV